MAEDKKVLELAEKLRKQGLAVSMLDAMEKAKAILSVEVVNKEKPKAEEINKPDFDITKQNITVNELMEQAGVGEPERIEETEIKSEIKETRGIEEPTESSGAIFEAGEDEKVMEEDEEPDNDDEEGPSVEEETKPAESSAWDEEKPSEEKEAEDFMKDDEQSEEKQNVDISEVFNYGKREE